MIENLFLLMSKIYIHSLSNPIIGHKIRNRQRQPCWIYQQKVVAEQVIM